MLARDMRALTRYIIRTSCCLTTQWTFLCARWSYLTRQANMWQNWTPASLGSEGVWVKFFSLRNTSTFGVRHVSSLMQKVTHARMHIRTQTTTFHLILRLICWLDGHNYPHINQTLLFLWFRRGQWPDVIACVISSLGGSECRMSGPRWSQKFKGRRSSWKVMYERAARWNLYNPAAQTCTSDKMLLLALIFIPDEYLSRKWWQSYSSLRTIVSSVISLPFLLCIVLSGISRQYCLSQLHVMMKSSTSISSASVGLNLSQRRDYNLVGGG